MFHNIVRILVYPILKIFYRISIEGHEKIPLEGPLIVAANHVSYLDPVMAGFSIYPRVPNYFAKKDLFDIPLFNLLIRALGAFPVERGKPDKSAIKMALSVLRRDGTLIMFPQGTRKKEVNEAYNGVSFFAFKTKAKVLPVAILGTEKVMPEGKKIPRFAKITVKIGEPLSAEGLNKDNLHNLTNQIMGQIIELMD